MNIEFREIIFLWVAGMTILPAFFVAFSRNILYSAFALFFTFLGTAGLYLFIDADFLAVVQVIIYIGGVLVLLIFAILLTRNIDQIRNTNKISIKRAIPAGIFSALSLILLGYAFVTAGYSLKSPPPETKFTVVILGDLLLNKYLLPFEIASLLLLAVLIGALVVANRAVRKSEV